MPNEISRVKQSFLENVIAENPYSTDVSIRMEAATFRAMARELLALRDELEGLKEAWRCYHCGEVFTDDALDELEAARYKLSGAPGTISGRMRGVLDFAEQECGHKSHSAKPGEVVLIERFLEMRDELEAARKVIDQYSFMSRGHGMYCDCAFGMYCDCALCAYLAKYGKPEAVTPETVAGE